MIYDKYIKLCNAIGKTPSAVALEIGLTKTTVNRWKKGGGATDATIQKLADYFGVDANEFKYEETPPTPEGGGLDDELIGRLLLLTPDEIQKVDAFVQGLLAARSK